MRRMLTGGGGGEARLRKRLKLPALLRGIGGFGLLGCVACCTWPLLGAIGIGGGAAAVFRLIEPLSAGLLALGGVIVVVAFVGFWRKSCAGPRASEGASCSTHGGCGASRGGEPPGVRTEVM